MQQSMNELPVGGVSDERLAALFDGAGQWMERRNRAVWDRRDPTRAGVRPLVERRRAHTVDRRAEGREQRAAMGARGAVRLAEQVEALINGHGLDQPLRDVDAYGVPAAWVQQVERAFAGAGADEAAQADVQRALFVLYGQSFASPMSQAGRQQGHTALSALVRLIEQAWERTLLAECAPAVDAALARGEGFEQTLQAYCQSHRLTRHPLFDYLAQHATREQLIRFFLSDSAVVLRFYDMVVLAMVGAEEEIRGELAHNLLDEMGDHDPAQRHTALFRRLLNYVGVPDSDLDGHVRRFHTEASGSCLTGHNLYLMLGLNRRHYFRSLGCLGSAELMDTAQYAQIVAGCHRLGWRDDEKLAYYTLHAEVDVAHGRAWLEQVMAPMVHKYPGAAREFLLGAAMRLDTAARYYDDVLAQFSKA